MTSAAAANASSPAPFPSPGSLCTAVEARVQAGGAPMEIAQEDAAIIESSEDDGASSARGALRGRGRLHPHATRSAARRPAGQPPALALWYSHSVAAAALGADATWAGRCRGGGTRPRGGAAQPVHRRVSQRAAAATAAPACSHAARPQSAVGGAKAVR